MLKREIVDQEREYKNQISALETKAHEQWVCVACMRRIRVYMRLESTHIKLRLFSKVAARQNERRLEESKAEAGQLSNRLTLVEKNLNDTDPEAKLHRKYPCYKILNYTRI